jgi:2-succinyl-5-enolpyruvyl-6-hydroxy-3-cyclohexene-1-carboxylate synthase
MGGRPAARSDTPAGYRLSPAEAEGGISRAARRGGCEHGGVTAPSTVLARLAVAALRQAGVEHVLLCPGSRSAPLAYALAAAADEGAGPCLHVRHDERVAAFTALGAVGAVVTTSGTAAANLHPAVLEAHHANRPLVVVTADRPRELRGTWANQTSELQAGLFGAAVRARLDLADTDAAKDPPAAATALLDVLAAARGPRPGPVHLDLGFTDPLVPDDEDGDGVDATVLEGFVAVPSPDANPAGPGVAVLTPGPRTVLVAGDGAQPGVAELAAAAGWPLLAEPSSGVAGQRSVTAYRLLLELPELGGEIERVVAAGRPTLSRPVTRLLARPEVDVVLLSPYDAWPEPGRPVRRASALDLSEVRRDVPWSIRWALASVAARHALDVALDGAAADAPAGPSVARAVARAVRPGQTLVAAASNPIRDLDLVGGALADGVRVWANRGLAGIDGTVSTAIGLGLGGGLVRVLVGDLAFLHDLNALLMGPGEQRPQVQVVVLNDDGGGIFSLLEHGERALGGEAPAATFERVFGTPHGADLASLCDGYGVPHRLVRSLPELDAELAAPPAGVSVLEVRSRREGLRELHARIRTEVHAAVRASLA